MDHTDDDCICIFVLTHGIQHDMISAKDVVYKADTIWKPFTADRCSTLAGKPKLFFFQVCIINRKNDFEHFYSQSNLYSKLQLFVLRLVVEIN